MSIFFTTRKNWFLIISVSALIFLLVFVPSFRAGVKDFSFRILLFPVKTFSNFTKGVQSKSDLVKENRELRDKIAELSLEMGRFKDLASENERLRDLLDLKNRMNVNTVSAEVISRNPNDWLGSFVINKGTMDGLEENSAVCSAEGLLGKIVEADKNTSNVVLITHPGFKAGGMLKDTRINGIIIGAGEGLVKMLYLPVDADIKEDEVVVTSGFSSIFPKGLTIGRIVSVHKSKTGLYKYAIIKPSADSFDQEEVLCIK